MDFEVLGPLRVSQGAVASPVTARMPRMLLGILLCQANAWVSVDVLVDALWGGQPDSGARQKLQIHVHRLRRALGDPDRIQFEHSGYRLRVLPGELDAERFEALLEEGADAVESGEPSRGAEVLRKALGLFRGEPYGELDDVPLLRAEAERLSERRLTGLAELYAAELGCGRQAAVVDELAALAAGYPLRERLQGLLMTALYRAGRQAEALEVYRRTRATLVEELGIDPGPELRRLQQAILAGDPALDSVARGPRTPAAPAQLPGDIADFTGRGDQLALLRDLLVPVDRPAAVVVSGITGKAGVGKTALAVRVAHQLREEFPDGQLYVDLRGAEAHPMGTGEVLSRFLRGLGVDGHAIPDSVAERETLYRSRLADKRMLVLLDNAASDAQLRPLLPGAAGCSVLVTSRARLVGLPGMTLVELDILAPEQAVELLARLIGPRRAAAEPAAAAEIARLCGYLPLAVRIAGARLAARPHWRLARLAAALADEQHRLDELALADLEVRGSLGLSVDALEPDARAAFRRLGLLAAPDFVAWVAAAVLDVSLAEGEETVDRLVDAQLVEVVREDRTGHTRFRFHDLVRVYARERALVEEPEAERAAAVGRACGAWMALAEHAYRIYCGGDYYILHGTAPRWRFRPADLERLLVRPLVWFEVERHGLAAAVRDAARTGSAELCWDLAFTAALLFEVRSYHDDWRDTHDRALAATREAGNRRGEAMMLTGLAELALVQSRYDEARELGLAAVRLFERAGERHGLAFAQRPIGEVDRLRGRYAAAEERYSRAVSLLREADDRGAEAYLLSLLGELYLNRGEPDRARPHLEEALRISQDSGSLRERGPILYSVAQLDLDEGHLERAGRGFRQALALGQRDGYLAMQASAARGLADVQLRQGRLDEAQDSLDAALRISRDIGFDGVEIRALLGYGELLHVRGRLDEAVAHLQQAEAIARDADRRLWEGKALHLLGSVHHSAGRPEAAAAAWRRALALFTELDSPDAAHVAQRIRAQRGGDPPDA